MALEQRNNTLAHYLNKKVKCFLGFYKSSYRRCIGDTLVNIATVITLPSSNSGYVNWD